MFGEVLSIEARTEHAVGAALGGQWPIAHPRGDVRPDAVVEARDVGLRYPVVGPPDLVRVADDDTGDLDGLSAHGRSRCIRTGPCRCEGRGMPADAASRPRSTRRTQAERRAWVSPTSRRASAARDRTATHPSAASRASTQASPACPG